MARYLRSILLLSLVLIASSASAVTMAWTPIRNPGNACDPQGPSGAPGGCFGSVGYDYSIGTYDVTNAQYAEFLNAKAKSDPLGLYSANMADPGPCCRGGIFRTGGIGSYTYSAISGRENMPVNNVDFFDALRFANWMNNGQGNGDTETGAYTLLGGTPTPSNGATVTRNPGATLFLTSEDEWYKAAYFNPGYSFWFAYPARSDTPTTCATPTATPNSANCGAGANPNGDLTPVGSYAGSPSPYGTFDQGGNVYQWNEAIINCGNRSGCRVVRGGAYNDFSDGNLAAFSRNFTPSTSSSADFGFRVAMIPGGYVPEPSTGLLVIAGLLGLAGRRRARG